MLKVYVTTTKFLVLLFTFLLILLFFLFRGLQNAPKKNDF